MNQNWFFNSTDKKIVQQLSSFFPDKIFDIHAHIYRLEQLNIPSSLKTIESTGPTEATISIWKSHLSKFFPGKELCGGLFFPGVTRNINIQSENSFLLSQLEENKSSRGLILLTPETSEEELTALLSQPRIAGAKIYFYFSNEQPILQSSTIGYFPEWQMEICNHFGSIIMLHLVKDLAVSDPANIEEIKYICKRYPKLKIILAHAGRSFHSPNSQPGIHELVGIDNLWFDTSAICEPESFKVVLNEFGPDKLMWGSDFPVSQIRGRSITLGDGFVFLDEDSCNWDNLSFGNPILLGIESLRALKWAAVDFGLNKNEIANIFYGNAKSILTL
ncbi:MAG: amidohydrolase family protein [Chitinophagaceae bacterium]